MCACSQGQLSLIVSFTRVYHLNVFNSLQTCIQILFSTCVFSLAALQLKSKEKSEVMAGHSIKTWKQLAYSRLHIGGVTSPCLGRKKYIWNIYLKNIFLIDEWLLLRMKGLIVININEKMTTICKCGFLFPEKQA